MHLPPETTSLGGFVKWLQSVVSHNNFSQYLKSKNLACGCTQLVPFVALLNGFAWCQFFYDFNC